MMLDEQLDEEMNNAILKLPTSDDDKFQVSHFQKLSTSAALDLAALSQAPSRSGVISRSGDVQKPSEWPQFSESSRQDSFVRDGRRVSTNPVLSVNDLSVNKLGGTVSASATPHLPSHGQDLTAHIQVPGSRKGMHSNCSAPSASPRCTQGRLGCCCHWLHPTHPICLALDSSVFYYENLNTPNRVYPGHLAITTPNKHTMMLDKYEGTKATTEA
ncbi:hypothetical protein V8E52_006918 [Russula decolorans]